MRWYAAALFKVLFRKAKFLPGRLVIFDSALLTNMALSTLELKRDVEVFPADLPRRQMAITKPKKTPAGATPSAPPITR